MTEDDGEVELDRLLATGEPLPARPPIELALAAMRRRVGLLAVVLGNPGDGSVNGWKVPVRKGRGRPDDKGHSGVTMTKGAAYRRWGRKAEQAFRLAYPVPFDGPVSVAIIAYWPRAHRKGPANGLAYGDVDAVAKATLDALEAAEVLANDAQAVRLGMAKDYDPKRPRVEVSIKVWDARSS